MMRMRTLPVLALAVPGLLLAGALPATAQITTGTASGTIKVLRNYMNHTVDMPLAKNILLPADKRLQFRPDVYSLFNTPGSARPPARRRAALRWAWATTTTVCSS